MFSQSDPKLVKIWSARGGSSASNAWNDEGGGNVYDDAGLGGPLGTIVANVEGTADFSYFITSGDSSDPSGQRHGLDSMCRRAVQGPVVLLPRPRHSAPVVLFPR